MKDKKQFLVTIIIYLITTASLIIGLSLPSGDSFLERILLHFGLPTYTSGGLVLYIPGAQLFIVILLCWLGLKLLYKNQVSLWKNGLILIIAFVAILWKLIIY